MVMVLSLLEELRNLLRPGETAAVCAYAQAGQPAGCENALVAGMSSHRRQEFLAGRTALRIALGETGLHSNGIGVLAGGRPDIPSSRIASVSHDGNVASAVAAVRAGNADGIGLDHVCAARASDPGFDAVFARVLAPDESVPQRLSPAQAFAAKEAALKAMSCIRPEGLALWKIRLSWNGQLLLAYSDDGHICCRVVTALGDSGVLAIARLQSAESGQC